MSEAGPDLYRIAYQEDPTPTLHRLRIEDPVHRTKHGYWFLTRYDDFEAGSEELTAYAKSLREHFRASVSREGGDTADPQEVADKIYECATSDTPVHNPVGSDAQMIVGMIGGPPRRFAESPKRTVDPARPVFIRTAVRSVNLAR